MQEELFGTLRRVGISDESVQLENVTLSREQNLLTVFFRCDDEPSIELSSKLTDELEYRLGGTRVRVEWHAKIAPKIINEGFDEPAAAPKPEAKPEKSSPSGKRILYGGFVSSNGQTSIVNLKHGADKSVIEGTIAVGKFDQAQMKQLKKLNEELLFVDFDGLALGINSLVVDFSQGVQLIIDQFIKEKHERIGILSGMEYTKGSRHEIDDPRFLVFREYLTRLKLYNEADHLQGAFTIEGGYTAMKTYLESHTDYPTAFFASSDALAIGAMRAIQGHGLRIPEDISVIGFNDVSVAKYVTPALTTVKVYTEWMGELAVSTILELIQEKAPVPRKITVGTELILRESTRDS